MSTRAHVTIKKGDRMSHMHHHCDGYPSGVGSELSDFLNDYKGEWEPDALSKYFNECDCYYNPVENDVVWDQEYVYVIDCEKKTLRCYYKGISDEWNYDKPGQEEMIPDNCFAPYNCMTAEKSQQKQSERNERRERIATAAMQAMLTGIMQSTLLMEQYSHRAAREGFKTMGALIASDAVGFANDLINELKKQEG